MGYYVQNTFTIRGGGVFSSELDMEKVKELITKIAEEVNAPIQPNYSISTELSGSKGSVIVIAGIFNYYTYDQSTKLAQLLSERLGTEVIHHCWDMEINDFKFQAWLGGKPLLEFVENPLNRVLRHVGG